VVVDLRTEETCDPRSNKGGQAKDQHRRPKLAMILKIVAIPDED
jgi:hypothetical protein